MGLRIQQQSRYNAEEATALGARFFTGDGGAKIAQILALSGEPYPEGLESYRKRYEAMAEKPPLVGALWEMQSDRVSYCKKNLEHWLASKDLTGTGRPFDGLISPVSMHSACPK